MVWHDRKVGSVRYKELQDGPVCHELIQKAAQRPQITSEGVFLVLPKLRWHIVGSADLGVCNTLLDHLGNAKVTNL